MKLRTFLVVQWLRIHTSTTGVREVHMLRGMAKNEQNMKFMNDFVKLDNTSSHKLLYKHCYICKEDSIKPSFI